MLVMFLTLSPLLWGLFSQLAISKMSNYCFQFSIANFLSSFPLRVCADLVSRTLESKLHCMVTKFSPI